MWTDNSVFYQIYPLGFCGAPFENGRGTRFPVLTKYMNGFLILKSLALMQYISHRYLNQIHTDTIQEIIKK